MLKKSLIILSIFCLIIFTSSMCFAENIMDNTKTTLENAGQGISNMAEDVKDGVTDMTSDIKEGTESAEDKMDSETSKAEGEMTSQTDNSDYTVARTSSVSTSNDTGINYVWLILAIVAIAIVALVWYYGMQTEDKSNH